MKTTFLALALAAGLAAPLAADRADDDLAAVKKAVGTRSARVEPPARPAERPAAEERRPAEPRAAAEAQSPRPRHGEARWFRVRVVEKGAKRGRVDINLPLGLVRAFGEDWPIHGCQRCEHGQGPTLGDVLRSLDSGQSLVEIDDEGATVRVWVD